MRPARETPTEAGSGRQRQAEADRGTHKAHRDRHATQIQAQTDTQRQAPTDRHTEADRHRQARHTETGTESRPTGTAERQTEELTETGTDRHRETDTGTHRERHTDTHSTITTADRHTQGILGVQSGTFMTYPNGAAERIRELWACAASQQPPPIEDKP